MSGARFVRLYPSDWRSGCIGLTLEEEGLYQRVCAHFWETGMRLPVDDIVAASRLSLDVRMYRRVKDKLIAKGKLHVAEDGLYNRRAEFEYQAAVQAAGKAEPKANVDSARGSDDREQTNGRDQAQERRLAGQDRVDIPATLETLRRDFAETSEESRREVAENFAKKDNYFNTPLKSHNHRDKKEEDNRPSDSTEQAAACGNGRTPAYADLKKTFNGSTEAMLEFVERSMGGNARPNAEQWLSATLAAHGAPAVAQAFAALAEKAATGEIIARPLAHWSNTAAGMKRRQGAASGNGETASNDRRPAWAVEKDQRRKSFLATLERL